MIFHSPFQLSYLWLPLIGLLVGLVGSMVGGGGGFVFPPALILFFKVPAQIAVATSLAATLPICLLGAAGHYNNGNLDVPTGLRFGLAGIAGAVSGTLITGMLTPEQLKSTFGMYIILIALLMIFNNLRVNRKAKNNHKKKTSTRLGKMITKGSLYGFTGGVISGTFGTSGTAPVLAGLFAIKLPLKLIAGTSLMVIFFNTVSALTGHLILGVIDLTLVWFLTTGTIIGAYAGPKITKLINLGKRETLIRRTFVFIILVFGIIMIVT
jgi:uncharacterized protein